jgi:hypothetical protein
LKPIEKNNGYVYVNLSKDGQAKKFYIHRLVAEAYIPNPEGKEQVNHKNEVKTDNYINNLEWATCKENINYGTRTERESISKGFSCVCVETGIVYHSAREAARQLGVPQGGISRCCRGVQKTSGGYHFEYYTK